MPETDQQPVRDASPLPPPLLDSPAPLAGPPVPAGTSSVPPLGRGWQIVEFLKEINWSQISFKGWIGIAIAVMIPIGLVMNALGYESSSDEPARAGSTAAAADKVNPSGANPLGGDAPEDSLMPNLICMNLQDAQDEIQDHGVFFSRSVDATGEGRNQIIDSNWVVVGQTPSAGSPIGEGDAQLSVVKFGETTRC